MYDKSDPRAALAAAPAAGTRAPATEFSGAEYAKFYETEPQQTDKHAKTWLTRGQNFIIAYSEATAGAVFEDSAGKLTEARRVLRWYPDDAWLYLLGCQWRRLSQEEPFLGRQRRHAHVHEDHARHEPDGKDRGQHDAGPPVEVDEDLAPIAHFSEVHGATEAQGVPWSTLARQSRRNDDTVRV